MYNVSIYIFGSSLRSFDSSWTVFLLKVVGLASTPLLRGERQGVLNVAKPDKTNKPFEFPGACGIFHAGSGGGPIVHVFFRLHPL